MKQTIRAAVASGSALLLMTIMALPSFALTNPDFVCEIVADGTHTSYSTSSFAACSGHTLVDANHQTMSILVLGECDSTTLNDDQLAISFNGDFATNYDFVSTVPSGSSPVAISNYDRYLAGLLPCQKSGMPAHAAGAINIKIPMASNTVFNKQSGSQDSFWTNILGSNGTHISIGGGNWHRPAVGAITRVDLEMDGGSHFVNGTKFAFYQE